MNNIFITGGSGFLGKHLSHHLALHKFNVYANYFTNPVKKDKEENVEYFFLDITDYDSVKEILRDRKIDLIVHTAYRKDNKNNVIVKGTENIVKYANSKDIPVIFISTDLIFSGKNGNYEVDDYAEPVSDYGKNKLMAEKIVKKYELSAIIRTSLIYCINHRPPHYSFIHNKLINNEPVELFIDELRNPVFVDDLVQFIEFLILNFKNDIYNFAGPDVFSRFELGLLLCSIFNPGKQYLLKPVKLSDQNNINRAANCTLNSMKAREYSKILPKSLTMVVRHKISCSLKNILLREV